MNILYGFLNSTDKYNDLVVLMREEESVYHYSVEPEFVRECYKSCDIAIGEEIFSGAGVVWIDEIKKIDDDVKVTFSYYDNHCIPKNAYVSLGQEVSFNLMKDDHTPDDYVLSKCSLSITSREYADKMVNSPDNNRIIQHKTRKITRNKSTK